MDIIARHNRNLLKELSDQKYALDQAAIVAMTDSKGKIVSVNDKFCQISGFNREELIGKDHRLVNSKTHSKNYFHILWETIQSGQIWRGEICNKTKTGKLYWVNTTIVPFLDETRRPYQYLAIRQDITELKKIQEQVLNQQMQLVNSSRLSAIGEMAAAITHEINNPLAVILGRCEMLNNVLNTGKLDTDTIRGIVSNIETTGRRIEKIVKSMRSLAHQQDEGELEPYSVNQIFEESLSLCQERFKNHGIDLKTEFLSPDMTINCRPHQLVQVLVNLLNNASDAIANKTEKWIRLTARNEATEGQNKLRIRICDSGDSIPENIRQKLFQPFFSTKRVQYGTGLGLSISQNLIKNHGGKLYYDDSENHTCFVIEL